MRRLRISAISFLNTAPLMWDFEHGNAGRNFDISYTVPSSCARALAAGTADIGIIPAAAYTEIPGLQIIPDIAIASRRAVRSILLVSNRPIEEVRTVALDTSSITSVALTKVLFEKWLGGRRTYSPMEPDINKMLDGHDAGLLIGDPALKIDRARYHTLDLADEWIRRTGKPFVFRVLDGSWRRFARGRLLARSACDFSEFARPRSPAIERRSHCARMGAALGNYRRRCSQLPDGKYSLPA